MPSGLDVHRSTGAVGAQFTRTLPFGLLIMFAVFSRFDRSHEEGTRDQGARACQTLHRVGLPITAPCLIGVALFGFELFCNEFPRTLLTAGSDSALPPEIFGMTTNVTSPVLQAPGTLPPVISPAVTGLSLAAVLAARRRRARAGNDAGKGMG